MVDAEEVKKAFSDYELTRGRLDLFTSKFYTVGNKKVCEKGIDSRKFHYILSFAKRKKRITPSQKRYLEMVIERLLEVEGIDLSIPIRVLREFLEGVPIHTKGNRGK